MSFFIFFIIYKNNVENNSQHENDVVPSKELGHAKIFENQFYRIFDKIEDYDFSNLVKKPKYRTGSKNTCDLKTAIAIKGKIKSREDA